MLQRLQSQRDERGFSLIEILVVLLIIAILAAIAVPYFLEQRERSFDSQAETALKNAGTAAESHANANEGDYPTTVGELRAQGYRDTAAVALKFVDPPPAGSKYCIEADHLEIAGTANFHYSDGTGRPSPGGCA